MDKRPLIYINEEKCDGCGLCVNSCAEGALIIIDGKAKLMDEIYCDGLGACIGSCPKGAISHIEREAKPFDEVATKKHLEFLKDTQSSSCECLPIVENKKLSNWPIQLRLVSVNAQFLKDSDLLIAADCTAFCFNEFHKKFLDKRKLLIACPKLDDAKFYLQKLDQIFRLNKIKSVKVLRMTVPCCGGLSGLVREAIKKSRESIPLEEEIIDLDGSIKK